jgi:hypothetical protein
MNAYILVYLKVSLGITFEEYYKKNSPKEF